MLPLSVYGCSKELLCTIDSFHRGLGGEVAGQSPWYPNLYFSV